MTAKACELCKFCMLSQWSCKVSFHCKPSAKAWHPARANESNVVSTIHPSLPGKTHCQDGRKTLSCIDQEVKGGLGARIQRWRKPREMALSFGCCWRP